MERNWTYRTGTILILIFIAISAGAQNRISIRSDVIRVDTLMRLVSRQTGVEFSFNSKKLAPSTAIRVKRRSQTVNEWLENLQQEAGVSFRKIGNHIILYDQKKAALTKKKKIGSPENRNKQKVAEPKQLESAKQSRPIYSTIALSKDTAAKNMTSQSITVANALDVIPTEQSRTVLVNAQTTDSSKGKKTSIIGQSSSQILPASNTIPASKVLSVSDRSEWATERFSKLDFGPQGVGLSFERRLFNRWVVDLSFGLGGGYAITGQQFKYKVFGLSGPDVYFSINTRWYYNRDKRLAKGKTLSRNSGNYLGFRVKYVMDDFAENFVVWNAMLINIHWGMQRPLGSRWVFNTHAGPGFGFATYLFSDVKLPGLNRFYPSLELKLSYLLKRPEE